MDESGDSDAWKPEGEGDDEEAEQSTFSVSGQGFSMDESMEELNEVRAWVGFAWVRGVR